MAASRNGTPTPPTPDDPDHTMCPICGWRPCTADCLLGMSKLDLLRCEQIRLGHIDAYDPFERRAGDRGLRVSEPIRQRVEMADFPGLDRDSDPLDVAAGSARFLVNLLPRPGKMSVRRGLGEVTFEETDDVTG